MKIFTLFLICTILFISCKEEKKAEDPGAIALRSEGKQLDLPYAVTKIPDWEKGDDKNIATAMLVLKSYEAKDFISIKKYLADTVELNLDNFDFKGSRDQTVKALKNRRDAILNFKIDMNDYESVRSKSLNEEWVSLWYTEIIGDRTGTVDTAQIMTDFKIANDKVVTMTKYTRLRDKN